MKGSGGQAGPADLAADNAQVQLQFDSSGKLVSFHGQNQVEALNSKLATMTPEQRQQAELNATRMKSLINQKLAEMSPEERAEYEKKHEAMTKTIMAQLEADGNTGQQPKIMQPAQMVPTETPEQICDRELLFAIRSGNVKAFDELLEKHGKDCNYSARAPNDQESHPLLHWAALNDQVGVIKYLVKHNADLDIRNPRNEVALHWACLNGNLRTISMLIRAGCDRTATDGRGYSAMTHAAQFGKIIVMASLLHHGVNVDSRDNNGRTPLHWAAYKGEDMAAKWLIDHGADIAAEDFEQCMPIHWAALQGYYMMSSLLVKNGALATLGAKDRTGQTADGLAREKQEKYAKGSYQHKQYMKVANFLEKSRMKKKDMSGWDQASIMLNHPTWYLWPVLSPVVFYQYYTVVLPETYYYPKVTMVFWLFYFSIWVTWAQLQLRDPGQFVLRGKRKEPRLPCSSSSKTDANGETRITLNNDGCVSRVNPLVPEAQKLRDMYLEVLDKGLLVPVCTTCEICRPLRCKHDRFTDVCIDRFDHFCPFMGVAIGRRNHFLFVLTMIGGMFGMGAWCYMIYYYTATYNKTKPWWENFYEMLGWELFCWFFGIIGVYTTVMVGQHLLFIKKNLTTNEVLNRKKYSYLANKQNPFNRGLVANFLEFCGIIEPVQVDFRSHYKYGFEGRSEEVDRNNRELQQLQSTALRPQPQQQQQQQQQGGHGHSHGGGGGHGHSHGIFGGS
mmetsp:Transcript_13241/g.21556  ORF Transcript_13241/g.21556 Transcript_13241/m.21556 type:complete len:730 (-) Transcript_13241:1062-3251(-)|eukprot:CAMPEP_0203746376 /NCGR_PEP_ID=MMETSP0098-20131031/1836_1 /ASSEMBLY_ACC=CAM_ASM_000208 /TAXON_ID=96639 /ORGANISM=" , Strain NY0313808BC1" /LENGTH=729 /DNA_ID=CAMNT_0050634455 /DNA_START=194 /DNA_END=2383 /DNA_ORIENTATION=-